MSREVKGKGGLIVADGVVPLGPWPAKETLVHERAMVAELSNDDQTTMLAVAVAYLSGVLSSLASGHEACRDPGCRTCVLLRGGLAVATIAVPHSSTAETVQAHLNAMAEVTR